MKRTKHFSKREIRNRCFYFAVLAFPLAQFILMYVVVNFNSFLLAFQHYDATTNLSKFVGFDNFSLIFYDIVHSAEISRGIVYSLIAFCFTLGVGITAALLFSYYIYKKHVFSAFYKVVLFLPSVISSLVLITIFRFFADSFAPVILKKLFNIDIIGLLSESSLTFGTVMFFSLWVGFGTQVLLYSNAMSGINEATIEAAKIDGVKPMREFLQIVLPQIFPTLSVFIVTAVAGIFANQLHLYSFFRGQSDGVTTIGYYIYKEVQRAGGDYAAYPKLAALGLLITLIIAPITLCIRWLLRKFDPMGGM